MAVLGYARVSSASQSLEIQIDQLQVAGCERVFAEKLTGSTINGRDELENALSYVRDGDTLVITRLDRLARSIIDLHQIIGRLTAKGVGFRCLHQPALDFEPGEDHDAMGKLVRSMLGAFAEFELDVRKARQKEGIEKAKAAGVYKGRPAKIDVARIEALAAQGLGATDIAKDMKIGRASVYRLMPPIERRA